MLTVYLLTHASSHRPIGRGQEFDDEDEEEDMWKECAVVPIKDDVAGIFARSSRGEKEFGEFSINQRAAVALGRYLQDPLVEIAGGLLFAHAIIR